MPILYHNRSRMSKSEEKELMARYVDMKALLSQSDFISLHVPLSDETRHLIGERGTIPDEADSLSD